MRAINNDLKQELVNPTVAEAMSIIDEHMKMNAEATFDELRALLPVNVRGQATDERLADAVTRLGYKVSR